MSQPAVAVSSKRILVQKFGGSSVATGEGREHVVARVRRAIGEGYAPVVVVSAMGRAPEPYATDTLISLLSFAAGKTDRRELDMLMACGETISVVVMAHTLRGHGIDAAALAGAHTGVHTTDAHGEALVVSVDPAPVLAWVERGVVPVVTGFQGVAPDGSITTLGRGGSDTSAVAMGVGLGAEMVEIYSDVDGVMTVDPRIYPDASLIPQLSYEELGELTIEGAKVVHPRAAGLAGQHGIPLRICSTFTDQPGTAVRPEIPKDAMERQRVVTAVTPILPVTFVTVHAGGDAERCQLLEALAARGLSLDLINVCQETLYFIVNQIHASAVVEVLQSLGFRHGERPDCAKLSIVGIGMRGTPGVMGRINRALHSAGVSVLHSTDSHITISCLIDASDVKPAVAALHREFEM